MKVPFTWKVGGETSDVPPAEVREQVEKQFLGTVLDAKPYMALRKWATQFYDVPPAVTASA